LFLVGNEGGKLLPWEFRNFSTILIVLRLLDKIFFENHSK
jgi:hypothetical protein